MMLMIYGALAIVLAAYSLSKRSMTAFYFWLAVTQATILARFVLWELR